MDDLCSGIAYFATESNDALEELTSHTSKWTIESNYTVDELTAQFVGFAVSASQPGQSLALDGLPVQGPRPIESFPEQWNYTESLDSETICRFCHNKLSEAYRLGTGWNHEDQCPGCGMSDRGRPWQTYQRKEDWTCSGCHTFGGPAETDEGRYLRQTTWQFLTKWDARQFAAWLIDHQGKITPNFRCDVVEICIFDDVDSKYNDTRRNAFDALREWHLRNGCLFDPAMVSHDLEHMVVYEPLCPAKQSYECTFHSGWHGNLGYPRRSGFRYTDPFEEYVPWMDVPTFCRTVVWLKVDGRWMFIKRKQGESNYSLYCRAYGLEEGIDTLLTWDNTNPEWNRRHEFETASLCTTREAGKICLHLGIWCWLPQMEHENPDQFNARVKQFETKRETRTKRQYFDVWDEKTGDRRFYDTVYTQEPDETLAEFAARFNDAPGEEPRKRRTSMMLDWAA